MVSFRLASLVLGAFLVVTSHLTTPVTAGVPLVDTTGKLKLASIPSSAAANGIVVYISSPGTPSYFPEDSSDSTCFLSLNSDGSLSCKGATLSAASTGERTSLSLSSLVADAVVVDGITEGDVEMGLQNSRHSRTLTALFRARLAQQQGETASSKQTLLLAVLGDDVDKGTVQSEVSEIFEAATEEVDGATPALSDLYDIEVVAVKSSSDAKGVSLSCI